MTITKPVTPRDDANTDVIFPQDLTTARRSASTSLLSKVAIRLKDSFAILLAWITLSRLVAAIIFLIVYWAPGLAEPDFYWHLKTGELIAQSGAIPTTDPYSFTFLGQPWVAHEWLAELVFYFIYRLGGIDALRLLPASAAAVTYLLMSGMARRFTAKEAAAALITACFFLPMIPYFCLRPQIFTYLCFATFLLLLIDFKYFSSYRFLWLLPLLMLAWVNVHGAYMAGLLLVALFIGTESVNRWLFPFRHPRSKAPLRLLCGVAGLTLLATLLNPQGIRILSYPFELVSMEASKTMISEWRSPDFHHLLAQLALAGIIAWLVATIYARRKPDMTELTLPLLMMVAGLTAWRHLPLMAITLSVFFCLMLRQIRVSELILKPWRRLQVSHSRSGQVSAAQAGAIHLALLVMVLMAASYGALYREYPETPSKHVATGAADYLLSHPVSGNMLNDYDLGGYLIWRLWPTHKVFIDGRADLYGDDFLKAYFKLDKADEGWEAAIDRQAIDIVVFARHAPLRQLLLASGKFREAYADAHHVVLLRDLPRFRALLDEPVRR